MLVHKLSYFTDKMATKSDRVYRNWLAAVPYENALCGKSTPSFYTLKLKKKEKIYCKID